MHLPLLVLAYPLHRICHDKHRQLSFPTESSVKAAIETTIPFSFDSTGKRLKFVVSARHGEVEPLLFGEHRVQHANSRRNRSPAPRVDHMHTRMNQAADIRHAEVVVPGPDNTGLGRTADRTAVSAHHTASAHQIAEGRLGVGWKCETAAAEVMDIAYPEVRSRSGLLVTQRTSPSGLENTSGLLDSADPEDIREPGPE